MSGYRFVQGIDYGPRDGTLALEFHMSEGGDELVSFLSRHPGETVAAWSSRIRGVSCHAAILSDETVQMVDFDHCNGNLNPADRAGEYGYFGHHHLVDVLGSHWPDPNMWSLSAEIAGRRADGPTDRQVELAIAWGNDMIRRYPTLRGTYGHHDQSPKGCPGTTPNMLAIFEGLGGHGLWAPDTQGGGDVLPDIDVQAGGPAMIDIAAGIPILNLDGSLRIATNPTARPGILSPCTTLSDGGTLLRAIVWTRADPNPDLLLAVYAHDADNVRALSLPATDTSPYTQAQLDAAKAAALASGIQKGHDDTKAKAVAAAEAL